MKYIKNFLNSVVNYLHCDFEDLTIVLFLWLCIIALLKFIFWSSK